jgi:hypothetical protein
MAAWCTVPPAAVAMGTPLGAPQGFLSARDADLDEQVVRGTPTRLCAAPTDSDGAIVPTRTRVVVVLRRWASKSQHRAS